MYKNNNFIYFHSDYYFKTLSKYGKLHCHPLIVASFSNRPVKIKTQITKYYAILF